ncbi:MAG: class A beta-lactamase, partial [Pseudomonadota bacterium]
RLRAGFPTTWLSGDKTGTGMHETMPTKYNDIAIVWPSYTAPGFVLATFYDGDGTQGVFRREDEKVLKSVGERCAQYYGV